MRCKLQACSPPQDCISFFDGCNVCGANNGQTTYCTQKFCFQKKQSFCRVFNDGRKCQALADCSGSGTTVATSTAITEVPASCIAWHDGESMHTRLIASNALIKSACWISIVPTLTHEYHNELQGDNIYLPSHAHTHTSFQDATTASSTTA